MSRITVPLGTQERSAIKRIAAGLESSLGVRVPEGRVARLLIVEALRQRGHVDAAPTAGGEE